MVIDLFGLEAEEVRERYPAAISGFLSMSSRNAIRTIVRVIAENWWIFGEPRSASGPPLPISTIIATPELSKHRFFVFLHGSILPDDALIVIATNDAYALGVLSSRIHVTWALAPAVGLVLETIPATTQSIVFEPFPFPAATDAQQDLIRRIAEELDAHRKRQQAQHPKLTLTDMYNVLEKLRSGEALTAKERQVHEQGLVSVLKQLHDELDLAVFDAYGWPSTLTDEEILERLVSLNAERAAEEAQGIIRWLRPDYQSPSGLRVTSYELPASQPALLHETVDEDTRYVTVPTRLPWPARMAEQAQAIRTVLAALDGPARRSKSPPNSPMRRWSKSPNCWRRWPVWDRLRRQGRGGLVFKVNY